MLPDLTVSLPASLMALLGTFQPLFTAPSFRTFCALAAGFLAQTGQRTVCGMLTGTGLSQVWRHDRAHRFFSHAAAIGTFIIGTAASQNPSVGKALKCRVRFEHRRLYPFGEPQPAMRRVDAGVLLENGGWIPRLESDFRTADTRPGRVTNEHRPSRSARLDEGPVMLGDELGIDGHVTDIKALPRSGLHDVVKRRGVGAEMLGKYPADQLQAVPKMSRRFSAPSS